MSRPSVGVAGTLPSPFGEDDRRWLDRGRLRLHPYRPPLRDWRFWATQVLVIGIAGIHTYIEVTGLLAGMVVFYFVPLSLFLIPLVYAALNFGFVGAVATGLWCTILILPNFIVMHGGEHAERVVELIQLGVVNAIAIFVGQRVDREKGARRRAEAAGAALQASEMKYRGLFESSPAAILVLDPTGRVLEANPAAGVLFGQTPPGLQGVAVADLIGVACAEKLLNGSQDNERWDGSLILRPKGGTEVYLEPALTRISDHHGQAVLQVLLRDVTEERLRHAGLRAYAAHILHAQEEERKRIAQELHDEIVQQLILLCRRLDSVESGREPLPASAIAGLLEARRSAEGVVEGLRDFARALRPPTLDDLGLVTCIRRLLVDLAERAQIKGEIAIVGEERRLSPDVELGLFRIAQAALYNVERHAQARQVTVTIAFAERGASLAVLDNGVGFRLPPNLDFAAAGQLGLLGMQERAESLGGRLEIQATSGAGTRVTVSLPEEVLSTTPKERAGFPLP